MFVLVFTRLSGTEESAFLIGAYDSLQEAQIVMHSEWEHRVNDKGWDIEWSTIEDNQAFCGTSDMGDTIRFYIFDTNHPYGFVNDIEDQF